MAIDLYCGLGGWAEGLLAEGWDVVGFDIERHVYGEHRYPAQLVIQDVLTLSGGQFRDADLIVASPPCQAYSYRAMPWKRAKTLPPPDNTLFEACFRIRCEACEAAGRHVPLIVENVRGAQKWVGRARWNFGSYYLWGDVPALMPIGRAIKIRGQDWNRHAATGEVSPPHWRMEGIKQDRAEPSPRVRNIILPQVVKGETAAFRPHSIAWGNESRFKPTSLPGEGRWLNDGPRSPDSISSSSSSSPRRKAASALIAKIPEPLARHIARTFRPAAIGGAA